MVSRDFQHTIISCWGISCGKADPKEQGDHGDVTGEAQGWHCTMKATAGPEPGQQNHQEAWFGYEECLGLIKQTQLLCLCDELKYAALLLPLQQGAGGGGRCSQRKSLSKCTFFHKTTEYFSAINTPKSHLCIRRVNVDLTCLAHVALGRAQ